MHENEINLNLPGFQTRETLHVNSNSQIFLATEEKTGRDVAIKTIPPNLGTIQTARKSYFLEKEVAVQVAMEHGTILPVLDLQYSNDQVPCIVLPYMQGGSLRERIHSTEQPQLSLGEKLTIILHIANGLDFINSKGVLFRDLKPGNVLLTDFLSPSGMIADFGSSSPVKTEGEGQILYGTLWYMSPEQLRGRDKAGIYEVYHTAVLTYELITGRRFINAYLNAESAKDLPGNRTILQTIRNIDGLNLPSRMHLTRAEPGLEEVFDLALKNKPEERGFRKSTEFAEALASCLEH